MHHAYFVYMLRCSDDSYYIGVTNDVDHRIAQHEEGLDPKAYTFKRRPLTLVYSAEFNDVMDAISWEKHIKRWSREKKEALIENDRETLQKLAECRNETHSKNKPSVSSRAETRGDTER